MKTLVIPVDFTPASNNAINFAAKWCKRYEYERIILLKTFYDSMFEYIFISAEYSNINEDTLNAKRDDAKGQLDDLCKTLAKKVGPEVKVTTAISEVPLLRGLLDVVQSEDPELILVGSDTLNSPEAGFISRNLINIARVSPTRVLVVPADYAYKPVQKALLPYNFNMLNDLDRLHHVRTSPLWKDIKMFVLNIDATQRIIKVPDKFEEAGEKFNNLLKDFEHEIYYTTDKNVINGINNFTAKHDVQLIIALPGKHSFLYTLTHQSISRAIYGNARLPVLILK